MSAGFPTKRGLYDPQSERDSCGIGFVAHVKGQRSHQIVDDAYQVLRNMNHRGACGCEPNTGDGAGMLTALPHTFLAKVTADDLHVELPAAGQFGAGIVFLPQIAAERDVCKQEVEQIIAASGQRLIGWRKVPTEADLANVGPSARRLEPYIEQLIIAAGDGLEGEAFERQLYLIRKQASHRIRVGSQLQQAKMFYICSLSSKVIIYKGMLTPDQLFPYYPDLTDPDFTSAPCNGPLPLLDQHVSELGSSAAKSVHVPQR